MKVKLDDYEVRVLINGLVQQYRSYDAETNGQQSNLSVPYGVAKSRDTGEKTRRSGCYK